MSLGKKVKVLASSSLVSFNQTPHRRDAGAELLQEVLDELLRLNCTKLHGFVASTLDDRRIQEALFGPSAPKIGKP